MPAWIIEIFEWLVAPFKSAKGIAITVALITILAIAALGYWHFFVRPARLEREVAQARVDAALSEAAGEIGVEAVKEQVIHEREIIRIERITKEKENAVRSAQGANVRVPAVADALRRAVCVRDAHVSQPECAALQRDHSGVRAVGTDSGGAPSER